MNERQISFKAPMVRALLDGSKTQTRRIVKWQGPKGFPHFFDRAFVDSPAGVQRLCVPYHHPGDHDDIDGNPAHRHYCPYGDPGDRLWVRETFVHIDDENDKFDGMGSQTYYAASCRDIAIDTAWLRKRGLKWKPSIHMPRWASRIALEIVSVRVERLQDISEADVIKEGCPSEILYGRGWYRHLWESINGPGSWDANPWVWCVSFKRILDGEGKS